MDNSTGQLSVAAKSIPSEVRNCTPTALTVSSCHRLIRLTADQLKNDITATSLVSQSHAQATTDIMPSCTCRT